MKPPALFLVASALALPFSTLRAQVTLGWDFTDLDTTVDTGTPVNFSVSPFSIGNSSAAVSGNPSSTSVSTGYTGATGGGNYGNAVKGGALDTATSSYYEVTLTPSLGNAVRILDFDFGTRSTGTGPTDYVLRWALDSYSADITSGSIAATSSWAYKDNTFAAVTGPLDTVVTLRLYTFGGSGSTSVNNRLDDIALTVQAVPEASDCALCACAAMVGLTWWRRARG